MTADSKHEASAAARVLCDAFILSSWLTIVALLVLRVQWFMAVWRLASVGLDFKDMEVPTSQGPILGYQLVLYDQSIFFYLLVAATFLLLLIFVRQEFGTKAKTLLFAVRALFTYSAAMIVSQILFLAVLRPPGGRSGYLFNSCLQRAGASTVENLVCIDDPHYVTLAVALLAMGLLASSDFAALARKILHIKSP